MSKPNLRKEIQKKEEFQAKFQLAMLSTNSLVSKWLNPINLHTNTSKDKQSEEAVASFHNLPIIANGSGLYSLETKSEEKKVSDFLNSNEEGLRKLKNSERPTDNFDRRNGNLKAMNALMNKMRNSSREKARQNARNQKSPARPQIIQQPKATTKAASRDSDSESDDEMSKIKSRSVKKGANLLFDSKITKKSR